RGDLAVSVAGDLEVRDMVAAVGGGEVVLAPALHELDGAAAELLACPGREHHVGVEEDLRTKSPSHVGADAADLLFRHAEDERGDQQPHHVRRLAGHPDRVLATAGVEEPETSAKKPMPTTAATMI